MGVATIALLGPLTINGDAAALSPRDRVVLSALALHRTEVSSVERLADALWGPAPPPSWPKVVPGCVHRLRRTLGVTAIETTPYGYRLAVDDDDIDARRFELLLHRGRELLALGDADRAAYTLGQAVDLWRGGAFPDLEGWEPGRIEAARLSELRLEAQESRIDAALQAGRHADMLVPAQSAVAQAPLRERRWALLALAQYRCGRQGEALQTLRRARQMLVTELGLDPGAELVALESAILRQDPSLVLAGPGLDSGECPYLGLVGYDIDDAEAFFGREWEIADCVSRLTDTGLLVVAGPSGSGKSSLVRAGVGATIARSGGRPVVMTPGEHPVAALTGLDTVGVTLIIDQFEEVFTNCADADERRRFCAEVVDRAQWCRVVIALRGDRLGDLAAHPELARLVERGLSLLGPMDGDALRSAITGPADQAGLLLEPGLVDLLVREVEGEPGALPLLSHALRQTWERRSGRTLTVAGYRETGGIREGVARSAEELYESSSEGQRELLRLILLRLITTTDDGDPLRTRVARRQLLTDPERERMVDRLVAARLVTIDRDTVQVAHESLGRAWPRLSGWLDEDVEGQRMVRHLSAAAEAWDGMGRPDSELYRGIRLDRAMDWRARNASALTPAEVSFLDAALTTRDADRRRSEEQARQRVRVRRRNRWVTLAVVAGVVAALIAGLLAVRQQHQREASDAAAALAEATGVAGAARGATDLDESLLLSVEAGRIQDAPSTRAQLTDLISGHPALIRSLVAQDEVRSLAVSPDGGTLLVGEGHTGTAVYRTDTLQQAEFSPVDGFSINYRPGGGQLVVNGRGSGGVNGSRGQFSAAVSDPGLLSLRNLSGGELSGAAFDSAYSGDGNRFAMYGQIVTNGSLDDAYLVWDSDAPDGPPEQFGSTPSFAIVLSPDGSLLYALTQQPSLDEYDVATGTLVRSVRVPPGTVPMPTDESSAEWYDDLADTLAISPDGGTLALGEGPGVVLYDAPTLTERTRLHGLTDRVLTVAFSPDGRSVAAGGVDKTVVVWDLATYGQTARLTGHGGSVLALAFAPDSATLYSAGADKRVLVWDLAGSRRFVSRTVPGSNLTGVGAFVPAPDGRAVMYTAEAGSAGRLQFLDMATGQMTAPVSNPNAGQLVTWLPPGDSTVVSAVGPALRRWDRDDLHMVDERWVDSSEISALAATPDGTSVLVGDRAGGLRRIDPGTWQSGPEVALGHSVVAIAPVPSTSRAIAFLDDRTYADVDLADGTVVDQNSVGFDVKAAAASPDGLRLAVGGVHGEVGLLDLTRHEWIAQPRVVPPPYLLSVAFAGDGSYFTTSSVDGSVHVWDGSTGDGIMSVPVADSPVVAVTDPADGKVLVAARDGAVYRIDPDFAGWAGFACSVAGRNLTPDEWKAVFGDQPYHETCPAG